MPPVQRLTEAEAQAVASHIYWSDGGVADLVWEERVRQIARWGLQERPNGTSRCWDEELGRARRIYEANLRNGFLTWLDILREEFYEVATETDPENLKTELVQVMAVAASWLQHLELGSG